MEMITRRLIGKEGGKQHSGMGNAREHKGIWNKISQKKKKSKSLVWLQHRIGIYGAERKRRDT